MIRSDDDPPPAVGNAIWRVVDVSELGVRRKVEACCGFGAEDLEPKLLGWPSATREMENVPAAPLANSATNVAMSIDSDDRAAELLAHVDQVTAEISERPEPSGPS
jgi:hypothetical protein